MNVEVISGFFLGLAVAVIYLLIRVYQVEENKPEELVRPQRPWEPSKPLPSHTEWETLYDGEGPVRMGDYPPDACCESDVVTEDTGYGRPEIVGGSIHVFLRKEKANETYEADMALYETKMVDYQEKLAEYQKQMDVYNASTKSAQLESLKLKKKAMEEELMVLSKRIEDG